MEVNLQDYVNVILRWWGVIIAVFLGALVVSAVVSFWQPSTYEASVTLYEPSYQVVAGERIESIPRSQKLYTGLVKSTALEAQVVEVLDPVLSPAEKSPGALLSMITVVANKDNPSLFEIKAQANDPDRAVQTANTWASEYLKMFNELNTGAVTELGFIRERLTIAESDLQSAEQTLRAFEQESGFGIGSNQEYGFATGPGIPQNPYAWYGTRGKELEAKSELLANHRVAQDNLLFLLDVARETELSGGGVDDLPLQLLNVQAITDRGQLSAELIIQEAENLDTVIELMQGEEQSLASAIGILSWEVEELHAELMRDKYEYLLLNRARGTLLERIVVLSRKAQELELQTSGMRIIRPAAGAIVASPSPWLNVVVAGVFGLLMGIILAFGLEYLRGTHA
jgi:capsular polysaccharide biosynthesis protein